MPLIDKQSNKIELPCQFGSLYQTGQIKTLIVFEIFVIILFFIQKGLQSLLSLPPSTKRLENYYYQLYHSYNPQIYNLNLVIVLIILALLYYYIYISIQSVIQTTKLVKKLKIFNFWVNLSHCSFSEIGKTGKTGKKQLKQHKSIGIL